MGALSEVTSGRTSPDGPINVPIGENATKVDDLATEVLGRERTQETTNSSAEEKLTINNGVKFADTKLTLTPENREKLNEVKTKLEELKNAEIKEHRAEILEKFVFNCLLSGGVSFGSMIGLADKLSDNYSTKLNTEYEHKLETAERALREEEIMTKFEGQSSNDIRADIGEIKDIQNGLNLLDKYIGKYDTTKDATYEKFLTPENIQNPTHLKEIEYTISKLDISDIQTYINDRDDIKTELQNELKFDSFALNIMEAHDRFGDTSYEERNARYDELKAEVKGLETLRNEDSPYFTQNMKDVLKEYKQEMRQLEIMKREDSLENFKNGQTSIDDFDTPGTHTRSNSTSSFDDFSNFGNNNFGTQGANSF